MQQMRRDYIGIRVNRAKIICRVNITSSDTSRERSGINTILHELNPLVTINVTMRYIKSKNGYSRVFFFSSTRRHTRSLCDWSSDVCSSDLAAPAPTADNVAAGDEDLFVLRHQAQGVGGESRGVADRGEDGPGARDVVAERDVAGLVHRDAAHPAVLPRGDGRVLWSERPLLKHRPRAGARAPYLEPADARMIHAVHVDDEITDQGLVAAEVAVLEPPHRPLVDGVERRRRSGLGDAGEAEEAATGRVEGRQRE